MPMTPQTVNRTSHSAKSQTSGLKEGVDLPEENVTQNKNEEVEVTTKEVLVAKPIGSFSSENRWTLANEKSWHVSMKPPVSKRDLDTDDEV